MVEWQTSMFCFCSKNFTKDFIYHPDTILFLVPFAILANPLVRNVMICVVVMEVLCRGGDSWNVI